MRLRSGRWPRPRSTSSKHGSPRHAACPVDCFDDFARLSRTLLHGPPFQWLLVDAPDERLREQVIGALEDVLRKAGLTSNKLPLSAGSPMSPNSNSG